MTETRSRTFYNTWAVTPWAETLRYTGPIQEAAFLAAARARADGWRDVRVERHDETVTLVEQPAHSGVVVS